MTAQEQKQLRNINSRLSQLAGAFGMASELLNAITHKKIDKLEIAKESSIIGSHMASAEKAVKEIVKDVENMVENTKQEFPA